MGIRIETPEGVDDLTEFLVFADKVYEYRSARWPAIVPFQLPLLTGESSFSAQREFKPVSARDGDGIVARAVAVVDHRYIDRWDEPLGHIVMLEAMPEAGEASKLVLDAACDWLAGRGMKAARAGFGVFEFPFAIDEYELLPPSQVRQNPPYYHRMLKEAHFESEKGWVDYKIEVTPELVQRWEGFALQAADRGLEVRPLRDVPDERRLPDFAETWSDAFHNHWGNVSLSKDDFASLFELLGPMGMFDLSVIGYKEGQPAGVVWVGQEMTQIAALDPGRQLEESEKLNFLGIGVRETARGTGLNLAMAAYSYLELVKLGAKYLSYTMVVDDNWPSRRTAEKLGAFVCANYLVYRRNFR